LAGRCQVRASSLGHSWKVTRVFWQFADRTGRQLDKETDIYHKELSNKSCTVLFAADNKQAGMP